MFPEIPQLLLILKEACEKFGFKWELVDIYSNNLVEVSNGEKSFFSSNSKVGTYPLNPKFSAQLVSDKAWCYEVLKQKGFKIPKGNYFFLKNEYRELRGEGRELKDAFLFAEKIGFPVFVKPNSSSLGILAEVIHDKNELKKHLEEISEIAWVALIQELIKQPEYRIFVLDGEIQFVYQRTSPKIIGDGKKSISEFISNINKGIKRARNKITENSFFLNNQLEKYNLTLNSILTKYQEFQIVSKANISAGGEIINYSEEVSNETKKWVKNLTETLQIRICGIDVFVEDSINNPDSFTVIEVNHNPNLTGIYEYGKKEKVFSIWKEILNKYFNY